MSYAYLECDCGAVFVISGDARMIAAAAEAFDAQHAIHRHPASHLSIVGDE